jgi:hypothetical protein
LANPGQKLRSRKLQQVQEHAQDIYRTNLAKSGLSDADIEDSHNRMRKLESSGGNTWAAFWTELDFPAEPELGPCVASAIEFDRLLTTVCAAVDDNRFEGARDAFAWFAGALNLPQQVVAATVGPGLCVADWDTAADWREVTLRAGRLLEAAVFDQFAHVDAVWANGFFSRLQPRPVFKLIAPKRRGETGVDRPVKRLLQLSFALHHWARYRTWPPNPPRPRELAEVFDLRGEDVSNLFDGTSSLYYEQFEKRWPRFTARFGLQQEVAFPAPLVAIAICWQQNLVSVTADHKLTSFILLDRGYEELWQWRRIGVAAKSTGAEPWAAWLDD